MTIVGAVCCALTNGTQLALQVGGIALAALTARIPSAVILRPTFFVGRRIYATGPGHTAAGVHRSFVGSPRLQPRTPPPQDDRQR